MYRKGVGPFNLSGLDENPDYTCPDSAELPVLLTTLLQIFVISLSILSSNQKC